MKRVDLPLLFCVLGVLVAAWLSVAVLGGPGVDLALPFTRVHAGNLHGVFPMGWPLVLAPFHALGLGWLANPLLHGVVAGIVSLPRQGWVRVLFLNATQDNLDWARGTSRQLYGYVYEPQAEDDAWALLPPDVSLGAD